MTTKILLRLLAAVATLSLVAAACGDDDSTDAAGGDDTADDTADDDAGGDTAVVDGAADCAVDEIDGDLAFYNWAEYIAPEELEAFEEQYSVTVTLNTYDSNEVMQPIITAGNSGYDLIVPSSYMTSILIAAESLQPLNQDAIPNMANLLDGFDDLPYDPGNTYSAPYQWGTTGLAVNTAVVGTDFDRSWGLIFDPEISAEFSGRISLLNDPRETMGAALKYLGYSLNTTNIDELNEAEDLVAAATGDLLAFDTDQADELMSSGETVVGHGYSGDMFNGFLETDNPDDFVYFVPKEGGGQWVDTIAIPFDAPHPCTATTFINWLLTAEHGAALTNFSYYSTPNEAAVPLLTDDLLAFESSDQLAGGPESLEQFLDTGEFEVNYSDAFIRAKEG
jgi:spermidine/putrescine-binding protein